MKKGFASIYLVIIFSALIVFIFVITEKACGSASASIANDICLVTGQSLLSEFQPQLQKRYGVLALNYGAEYLASKAEEYLEYDLNNTNTLVNLQLENCKIDTEGYGFFDSENFSNQISALGLALLAKSEISTSVLQDNATILTDGLAGEDSSANLKSLDSHVESIKNSDASDSLKQDTQNQSQSLKEMVSSAKNAEFESSCSKDISDNYLVKDFASTYLNISSNAIVGISFNNSGDLTNYLAEAEYIVQMFTNLQSASDSEKLLDLEAEYVLFGKLSDAENEKAVKLSLFTIRSGLNLVNIYSSAEKTAMVAEIAAGFSEIPYPISFALVSAAYAAIYAKADVEKLVSGISVPFLDSIESGGSYEDYLLLMLAAIPQKKRLARAMDIMQLNINAIDGVVFSFRDSAYGFKLSASFTKKMRLPSFMAGSRKGTVAQVFSYE